MPEQDITHQALTDLGSEAIVDSRGKIMVRLGNATFDAAVQHGGDDIDPRLTRDLAARVVENLKRL